MTAARKGAEAAGTWAGFWRVVCPTAPLPGNSMGCLCSAAGFLSVLHKPASPPPSPPPPPPCPLGAPAWGLCPCPAVFEFPHPSCGRGESLGLVLRVNTPQHLWDWSGDLLEAWAMLSRHLPSFRGWLVCQVLPAYPHTGLASPVPAKRVGTDGGTGWVR